jgi:hypothetical protein
MKPGRSRSKAAGLRRPRSSAGGRRFTMRIRLQLLMDSVRHFYIEEIWQAQYEKWVEGLAQDLYKIYNDSGNIVG